MKTFKKFSFIMALGLMMSIHTAISAEDLTINNSADFVSFAQRVNAGESFAGNTITLNADIDMEGVSWVPAGTKNAPFSGTFDGGNHSIINLTASFATDKMCVGLIGYNKGTVKNLTVEAAVPSGEGWDHGIGHWNDATRNFSAIIVGYNEGNIDSCKAQGVINIENLLSISANGGVCGYNRGSINNCINEARIYANNTTDWDKVPTIADAYVGGIAGLNEGTVTACQGVANEYSSATSTFGSTAIGCIVGDNRKGGVISGCTASGTVLAWTKFAMNMGYAYAGGIAGSNGGTIKDCTVDGARVIGIVQGADISYRFDYADIGGICGYNYGTVENSTVKSTTISGGIHSQEQPSYKAYAGGIVGYNRGTVRNVTSGATYATYAHDSRTLTPDYLGGICGYNEGGIISRAFCTATSFTYTDLNGRARYLGGVVGVNDGGYVYLSGSTLTLSADTAGNITTGGIAGMNSGMIENCYHTGTSVRGNTIGGIVGTNTGSIACCYSRAILGSGSVNKDGVTYNNQGYVRDCYTYGATTCEGGIKETTANLKKKETFVGWDFDVFWKTSGNFPVINEELGELKFFGEGNGSSEAPYMITTEEELNRVRYQPDKNYRLMQDIVLTKNWSPIGTCEANAFTGTFDGNGHKISNVVVNGNGSEYNGLFGYVDGAGIYNLTVENATYTLNETKGKGVYVGGIAGFARNNATIENCAFYGTISAVSPVVSAGGIAGDFEGTVKGCRASGILNVNAGGLYTNTIVGGICGKAEGLITGANSEMNIVIREQDKSNYPMETSGGIAGRMKGDITDSRFEGSVDATDKKTVYHGGIAGSIEGNIRNSYSDYEMGYNDSINGAVSGQIMQGDCSTVYYNSNKSYDSYGTGTSDFASAAILTILRNKAEEKKYIWVKSMEDNKAEPLYVNVDWIVDENGFTRCVLTANTEGAKIYYTTDGTTPDQNSTLYEGPILVDLMDKISYYVVSGVKTSEVMGFVSAPHSEYAVQIASVPKNQNGEALTAENITSATDVTVDLLTEKDSVGTRVYLAVFDEDRMVYVSSVPYTLVKGSNEVKFEGLQIPSGSKIQIYVWDDVNKLSPCTKVIKL